MKKLALILALLLVFPCLAACHGAKGTNAFTLPEEFDDSREYEITFWAKNDTNVAQKPLRYGHDVPIPTLFQWVNFAH